MLMLRIIYPYCIVLYLTFIAGAHFTTNVSDSQSEGSSVSGRRSVQMPGEENFIFDILVRQLTSFFFSQDLLVSGMAV